MSRNTLETVSKEMAGRSNAESMTDRVEVERWPEADVIRLSRSRVRNAIDNETLRELEGALQASITSARPIVLTGAGGTFCAGSDLKALSRNGKAYQREHTRLGQALFRMIETAHVLTVALVEGYCLGGGVELALACDLRVAVADSVWGFPEVTVGAIPAWGGTQRLPRFVGLGRAKRLLLTGERLTARELADWGLIDMVVGSTHDGVRLVRSVAKAASSYPPRTFGLIKNLVLRSFDGTLKAGMRAEAEAEEWAEATYRHSGSTRRPTGQGGNGR